MSLRTDTLAVGFYVLGAAYLAGFFSTNVPVWRGETLLLVAWMVCFTAASTYAWAGRADAGAAKVVL